MVSHGNTFIVNWNMRIELIVQVVLKHNSRSEFSLPLHACFAHATGNNVFIQEFQASQILDFIFISCITFVPDHVQLLVSILRIA